MHDNTKFRSLKAFRDYEQSTFSVTINPNKILGLLKHWGGSMEKRQIAEALDTDVESINRALISLLQEGVVIVEPGGAREPGKDVVRS